MGRRKKCYWDDDRHVKSTGWLLRLLRRDQFIYAASGDTESSGSIGSQPFFTERWSVSRHDISKNGSEEYLCYCGKWFNLGRKDDKGQSNEEMMTWRRQFADARTAEDWVRRHRHGIPQAWEWYALALLGIGVGIEIAIAVLRCG